MTEASHAPTDEELHEDLMEQLLLGIHVAMPGRIQSYDAEHQVADIIVGLKHTYPDPLGSGEYLHENYPVLPAVPILFPRMGRWFMAMSVEPGDAVQLLFNSSAIGLWRRSTRVDNVQGLDRALQGISLVGDVGRHHLTHAVALLGLETFGNRIRHAPPLHSDPDAGLTFGSDLDAGTRQKIKGDGALLVEHGTTPVFRIEPEPPPPDPESEEEPEPPLPPPEFVALAAKVDAMFSGLRAAFDAWTVSPNDGGAALKAALESWSPTTVAAKRVKAT